ncbi:hypothetical protein RHMOL_Rhmol01G0132200 [Rhododendron molle]|uniref:Uncharacterized protein n=1 Tax=Rhododendron molle TaxID=49168 RepID=A0ACC0Q2C7_RHOML|nr:hypothetical protein RHMOL_Rhmol01G0132200 [Rhododendron molle]
MNNNACLLLKAFVARFAASSEVEMNELVNEETSIEASILHELQGAVAQLSEKTRIGFRDAFYRLAKNSEQYMENHSQNGDLVSDTVHDETLRSENTKTVESETNSIDRAIANLLFNKTGSVQESNGSARLGNYNLSLTQPPHYPQHTRLSSDALVPIFSTKEKPPAGGDFQWYFKNLNEHTLFLQSHGSVVKAILVNRHNFSNSDFMRSTDILVGGFEGSQSQPTDFTGIGRQMARLAETGYGQGLSAVLVLKKYRQFLVCAW